MSLFQCEECGCCENTALSSQGHKPPAKWFDWYGIEDRMGKQLCSACGPTKYASGETCDKGGGWHGQFERLYLPKGMFKTNHVGNLAHKDTGDENYRAYQIKEPL